MENVSPTRMNLLGRKAQVSLAKQGVDLLKKKRDALVTDFFVVVKNSLASREQLNQTSQQAVELLNLAVAFEGRQPLESSALPGRRDIRLNVSEKNVWGIKIPEVSAGSVVRDQFSRGYSPTAATYRSIKTTDSFEQIIDLLIVVAGSETRLKRLGSEIKKTTRRVNALEQVVIPRIYREMGYIKGVLEQREREDIFRLKMIKKKGEG
ncbi:V-type ATP synthase subunit D [candidate division TA06 bacterium]|uniref:V-type ATP synthase subunit D n=1 Tax=candidate division TA06 bacterium TaxID=2250710 RepID=A0A933MK97_UNCT6|nr:V-type ATP synthase subunit D [candidate division TA06 bacterium]